MDINKEKIAHEKHLLSQGVDFKYLPNIQYNELENVYELIEWDEEYSEALNEINSSWCTWQAAKAVPDGFVLVERSKLLQILGSAVAINTNPRTKINLLESDFIIGELKAMLKAQEQAND